MKTSYISTFFYFLLSAALMPLSSLNVNAEGEGGDSRSLENQSIDKTKKEDECKKKDTGSSRMSVSSSVASISGGLSALAPDQANPSFVGLLASNIDAPLEIKTRSTLPVSNFPGGISSFYATPQSLTPFGKGAEILRSEEGWVRQVRSATGFLNVEEIPNGYVITGYNVVDIPTVKKADGFYNIPTGISPLSKRIVTASNGGNKIKIEETTRYGKVPRTETVVIEQTLGKTSETALLRQTWSNHDGVYKIGETELKLQSSRAMPRDIGIAPSPSPSPESFIYTIKEMGADGDLHIVGRKSGKRISYRKDEGFVLLSECNAVDEAGNPLPESTTTTYTYYLNYSDRASYARRATMRRTDGYWENYSYSENLAGGILTIRTMSPWMNTPAPSSGSAAFGPCRVKEEVQLLTDTGTCGVTTTVNGVPIQKYWVDCVRSSENTITETLHQPHSGGDKVTITKRYCRDKTKIGEALMGKPVFVKKADGSLETYTYKIDGNTLTTTKDSGFGASSSVVTGTRVISKTDKITQKLKEEINYAIQDGQLHFLSSMIGVEFDPAGNCLKWIYNNNPDDYSEQQRDCCQINWERARNGVETTYTYNSDGKLIKEVSQGKIITYEKNGLNTTTWRSLVGQEEKKYLVEKITLDMAGNIKRIITPTVGGGVKEMNFTINVIDRTTMMVRQPDGAWKSIKKFADGNINSYTGNLDVNYSYDYKILNKNGGAIKIIETTLNNEGEGTLTQESYLYDILGNVVEISLPMAEGSPTTFFYHDQAGRLAKRIDPDGVVSIQEFKQFDIIVGFDIDRNGILELSKDRIERLTKKFDPSWPEQSGSWKISREVAEDGNWKTLSTNWVTEDKIKTRNSRRGVQNFETTTFASPLEQSLNQYNTTKISPNGLQVKMIYTKNDAGVVATIRTEERDKSNVLLSWQDDTLDAWENILNQTEARVGMTSYTYDESTNKLLSLNLPTGETKSYQYDLLSRLSMVVLPDGGKQYLSYDERGNIKREWGKFKNPVEFEYDYAGRMISLKTFRTAVGRDASWPDGDGDLTEWKYDQATGNLLQKQYADGTFVSYSWTKANRLKETTNLSGLTTTYTYDSVGRQTEVSYNDNRTPARNFIYDQAGRISSISREGVSTNEYIYNEKSQIVTENISYHIGTSGNEFRRTLERQYDACGRYSGYKLKNGTTVEQQVAYHWNEVDRVSSIVSDGQSYTYQWNDLNPKLLMGMESPIHKVVNTYEGNRNILVDKKNRWKGASPDTAISHFSYAVNINGTPVSMEGDGDSFETQNNTKSWNYDALGQLISENSNTFTYDQIGNRMSQKIGDKMPFAYQRNTVNQYLTVDDVEIRYDQEGNLTEGLFATEKISRRSAFQFEYDAENRLKTVRDGASEVEDYLYDAKGRMIKQGNIIAIYDGHNLIAQYDMNSKELRHTYAWGVDVSGDIFEAGGVGGLLSTTNYQGQLPAVYYAVFDGMGNVSEYISNDGQTISAHYEYDSFGNKMKEMGRDFIFQFSSKIYNQKTGLLMYNFRNYDPVMGRWMERDPLGENGGYNVYSFVNNDPVGNYDPLGLTPCKSPKIADDAGKCCCKDDMQTIKRHAVLPAKELGRRIIGHEFIECPGYGIKGKHPKPVHNIVNGTGEIRDNSDILDELGDKPGRMTTKEYRACPESVATVGKKMEDDANDEDLPYDLVTNNCTDWVDDLLKEAGFPVPKRGTLISTPGDDGNGEKATPETYDFNNPNKSVLIPIVKIPL